MSERDKRNGLVLVNTGDGKGKTTASLGVIFRALGWDWKIQLVQFFKGQWKPGEERVIEKYNLPVEHKTFGSGFTWECEKEDMIKECNEAFSFSEEKILSGDYDLIVLDEINIALSMDLLDVDRVINVLKKKPKYTNVILSGRGAPKKLREFADLVSDIKAEKHPFDKGIPAQKGIEF